MQVAAIPSDEADRLADLRALAILDTPAEERFDRIVKLAMRVFGVPMAYVALIDSDRQWFKARCGISASQTARSISFCAHTILGTGPLIIPDASQDPRFFDSPLVLGEPHVRFYAGYPLRGPHGHNVGTLCLADRAPRRMSSDEMETLRHLAELVERELQMVDVISAQRELLETKQQLLESQQRLHEELAEAEEYVRSLLPEPLSGPVRTDFQYLASSRLGGDLFGYHWLDDLTLVVYVLDVMGHGVGASLLAASVHSALRSQSLPATDFTEPDQVLAALNRAFPMEQNGNRFFTIWYGTFCSHSRVLRYCSAGHPPGLLFPRAGRIEQLGSPGLMIGVGQYEDFQANACIVPKASRLYLASDGAFETPNRQGDSLGLAGLASVIAEVAELPSARTAAVIERLRTRLEGGEFLDDVTLLEVEFAE
jgi:sigma-B regulation protein RsbU (phosphoserine phosphatase)